MGTANDLDDRYRCCTHSHYVMTLFVVIDIDAAAVGAAMICAHSFVVCDGHCGRTSVAFMQVEKCVVSFCC